MAGQIGRYKKNFKRFSLLSPVILGSLDEDLYDEDGTRWHCGTGLLAQFLEAELSYYCASTYNYDFKPDTEAVTRILNPGVSPRGLMRVPTPSLVLLLRYFYYQPHGWNARILYSGLEINVDPSMLLPLDAPRNFGWEEFEKAHLAFDSSDWLR